MTDADRLVTTGIIIFGIGAMIVIAAAGAGLFQRRAFIERPRRRMTDEQVRRLHPLLAERMGRGARR